MSPRPSLGRSLQIRRHNRPGSVVCALRSPEESEVGREGQEISVILQGHSAPPGSGQINVGASLARVVAEETDTESSCDVLYTRESFNRDVPM